MASCKQKNPHLCNQNRLPMIRVFSLAFAFIAIAYFSVAQTPELIIKSGDNGFYLEHKVAPKENFYSVGRLYNAPPKEIAAYNKLDMNKGLNLGQTLRIPLSASNFSQTVNEGTPIYYKVGENEGLLKISSANNKVLPESLRKWNNLSSDKINAGNKLIVGFLISNEMPMVKIAEKEKPVSVIVGKTETITPPPIKITEEVKNEDKAEVKKEDKAVEKPVIPIEIQKAVVTEKQPVSTDQGYFKSSFDQQIKTNPLTKQETVTAGIFKTASGWKDAKYYALIDGVQSGTIIRIANPSNDKVVYAKVLGEMSGIRQNAGYNLRISNSAATALQITDQDKFVVKVNY